MKNQSKMDSPSKSQLSQRMSMISLNNNTLDSKPSQALFTKRESIIQNSGKQNSKEFVKDLKYKSAGGYSTQNFFTSRFDKNSKFLWTTSEDHNTNIQQRLNAIEFKIEEANKRYFNNLIFKQLSSRIFNEANLITQENMKRFQEEKETHRLEELVRLFNKEKKYEKAKSEIRKLQKLRVEK